MQIDTMGFNADHYKNKTEADFIKDQLASVPNKYGTDAQKTDFLKTAWEKMNEKPAPAAQTVTK